MLNELPDSSFLRFDARRLANRKLLWARDPATADKYLREYGWCCALPEEPASTYLAESVSMRAERYGGGGVGVNGGGVRCGWHRQHQIKGIGRTDLAGVGAPHQHTYGGATANAAVREAIWGEMFNAALPYGAVVVHAIIATGSTVRLAAADHAGNTSCQRALSVRPAFLRPAHYMRATLFRPSAGFMATQATDVERTKLALRSMRAGLAVALGADRLDPLPDLLSTAFRRYAAQIAAARAKRLVHSSISASNIALDGRFLDFSGASSVSDHGRIIIAPGCPDAWQQHALLLGSINDLAFYLSKYAGEDIDHVALATLLRSVFLGTLEQRFAVELLKLSGVPEATISALPYPELADAASAFSDVLEAGNCEAFKLTSHCAGCGPQMPERMGRYHLGSCIKRTIASETRESAEAALTAELPDAQLRRRLVAAVWHLRSAYLAGHEGSGALRALEFLRLNAHRLNARLDALYFHELRRRIDVALAAGADMQDFVSQTVAGVVDLLREPLEGEIRVCVDGIPPIVATPTRGLRLGAVEIGWPALQRVMPELCGVERTWRSDSAMRSSFLRVYPQPNPDRVERYTQIGYAMHLLSQSPLARHRQTHYANAILAPAIAHQRINFYFDEDGAPAAFVVWANLAPDVEERVFATSKLDLHFSEWNEGSSLWILDLVAPFGHLKYVLQHARDVLFRNEPRVRFMRQVGECGRVVEIERSKLSGCLRSMPAAPPSTAEQRMPA